jgi:pyruvate dehydrogenase E2 component (dihydrolipoamide acetyltransferase)
MLRPLTMPQIALGADEVIAREWLLEPGAEFSVGQPILEIETDKATMEVEAPFDGMLVDTRCSAGDTVAIGALIGHAAEAGASLPEALAELAAMPDAGAPAAAPDDVARPVVTAPQLGVATTAIADRELVRSVVVPHGELAGLPLERPAVAERLPAAPAPAPAPADAAALDDRAAAGAATERTLSRRRLAIARRMTVATAIPSFVVMREIATDAGKRAVAAARETGTRVTFTDVLLRACALAGRAHPSANAWLLGETVVEFEHVNVSLAVDAPDGVMAPVVRSVDTLDLAAVAAVRGDLVTRARAGELENRELLGATLTLSNVAGLGAHGITPVLTAPQVVALGVGTAREAGGREVVAVTLVGDHRVLDGADGARFLTTFAEALESASEL